MMSFKHKLFQETSIYSLIVIRILFGLLVLWECYDMIASDIIDEYYVEPNFYFTYYGFGWVEAIPKAWIYWFFCLLAALAICITLGLFYRTSIILFTVGFTYVFFTHQMGYLNHYYMIILFSILLSFMPANRYFSLDSYFNPGLTSKNIPFWPIFLLRCQLEIILIFAGLVKINHDWLQRLMPLKLWLDNSETIAPLHYLFTQDWSLTMIAYGVVILHVLGAPLLLIKKARPYIFIIYCCFHIANDRLFQIGSFPWMSIALTTVFFSTDWPKMFFQFFDKTNNVTALQPTSSLKQYIIITLATIWIISQILIPLRYLLYPGNPSWTGQGKRFAWRMKLNDLVGTAYFYVTDPKTNHQERVHVGDYITYAQFNEMQCRPDMILQFGHYIHKIWTEEKGYEDVKVTTKAFCALNGRDIQLYLDPNIDLSKIERNLKHKDWILPLQD